MDDNFVKSEEHKDKDLNQKIQDIIKNDGVIEENEIESIIQYVLGDVDNGIRNLCLLNSRINRSYKNAGFKSKRSEIIQREKGGTFIPICTRNVFMKYYYEEVRDLEIWNEADRESYFKNIETTIEKYLPNEKKQ